MSEPQEHKIKLIDFKNNRIISGLDDFVALHEKHLEYKWKCYIEITDEDGKREVEYMGQRFVLKEMICGVEAFWSDTRERYCTTLIGADNSCWIFETMAEAVKMKQKVQDWLLEA